MSLCAGRIVFQKVADKFPGQSLFQSLRKCMSTMDNFDWNFTKPNVDTDYLIDAYKKSGSRRGSADIKTLQKLQAALDNTDTKDEVYRPLLNHLFSELNKIPNKTHPDVIKFGSEPNLVKLVGTKKMYDTPPKEFYEIVKRLKLARTDQLGNVSGSRSYYLLGQMAELEDALIRFTLNNLIKKHNFCLVSVPDVLHRNIIEGCGMNTKGIRNQVYSLETEDVESDLCLSGTSEMALAGMFANKSIPEKDLPVKIAAVSRCYRAETSSVAEERGIYRVHEFTKVEMFAITKADNYDSDEMLKQIRTIQEEMFSTLGLHFRVLDMPSQELGIPAYRKFDIEAWMPGRSMFGEISSCSNCTDYQSRRLGIRMKWDEFVEEYVHTINGTACAIPRMLIALVETYQKKDGTIAIPEPLQKYMRRKTSIGVQKYVPELRLVKNKKT